MERKIFKILCVLIASLFVVGVASFLIGVMIIEINGLCGSIWFDTTRMLFTLIAIMLPICLWVSIKLEEEQQNKTR